VTAKFIRSAAASFALDRAHLKRTGLANHS
jgi:hypothetical protein